jgi:predicted DNA-binding protein
MKRTTIMLPDELKIRATHRARKLGISLGGFIRESLENALDNKSRNSNVNEEDPFFADDAVYHGDVPSDLSEKHDDYLYG